MGNPRARAKSSLVFDQLDMRVDVNTVVVSVMQYFMARNME